MLFSNIWHTYYFRDPPLPWYRITPGLTVVVWLDISAFKQGSEKFWNLSFLMPLPLRGLEMQNGRFQSKIALRLKKVCYKVCAKTVGTKLSGSHWPNYQCRNYLVEATPSTWNFGSNWSCWTANADFQSMFARSRSAVTPSEKSSINTNRKSTTRFLMSLRWSSYVASKPTKGLKNEWTAVFRVKLHFTWSKSKSSLCKYCQQ